MKKYPFLTRVVYRLIQEKNLIAPGDKVLVAFSGGPDSTALADILDQIKDDLNFRLALFHLNHGLRGEEALRDQNFCLQWAKSRNLEIFVKYVDISKYKKEISSSWESAARQIRYRKLTEAAKKWGAKKVALGHHRNDQVETILMNVIRGTGINGLRGMPLQNGIFIRPLLRISSETIHHYIQERQLSYVVDSTNRDISLLRNKLRHHLIPLLEKEYNPNIEEVLFRLALNLQESQPNREEDQWPVENRGMFYRLPLSLFVNKSTENQRRGLIALIKQVKGDIYHVTRAHFKALEYLLQKGKGKTMLPDKISIWIDGGYLYAHRGNLLLSNTPSWRYPLVFPGINLLNDVGLKIELFKKTNQINREVKTAWCEIDEEKSDPPFYLRNFLNGDRVVIHGKEKKLKAIFQNLGISESWRRRLPILCDRKKILWIPGILLDERAQVQENSRSIIIVTIVTHKG